MSEYRFENRTFASLYDIAIAYTSSVFEVDADTFLLANDHTGMWDVWAWNAEHTALFLLRHDAWSKHDIDELTPRLSLGVDF